MSDLSEQRPTVSEETHVSAPEPMPVAEERPASSGIFGFSSLALVLIAFVALFGYSIHERNVARQLAHENEQVSASLKDTRGQMDALNAKLDALTAAQQAAQTQAATPVSRPHAAATAVRHSKPDPRWKKFQAQLDAQGKEIADTRNSIDATRNDLNSTRTELSGSIAKTHDELVVLQRKGERNYFEFDLDKSKQFTHAGPVGISLRKANTKHDYADLELMVDDRQISKKHLNLYEPAMFYASDAQAPMEIVINSITKNHIRGYLSTPKYRASELASMSTSQDAQTAAASSSASPAAATAPQLRHR